MIMRGTIPRMLSGAGLFAVLGLGAVLWPLLPTRAQSGPAKSKISEPARDVAKKAQPPIENLREIRRIEMERKVRLAEEQHRAQQAARAAEQAKRWTEAEDEIHSEMERSLDEIVQLKAQIARLELQLAIKESRMRQMLGQMNELRRKLDLHRFGIDDLGQTGANTFPPGHSRAELVPGTRADRASDYEEQIRAIQRELEALRGQPPRPSIDFLDQ